MSNSDLDLLRAKLANKPNFFFKKGEQSDSEAGLASEATMDATADSAQIPEIFLNEPPVIFKSDNAAVVFKADASSDEVFEPVGLMEPAPVVAAPLVAPELTHEAVKEAVKENVKEAFKDMFKKPSKAAAKDIASQNAAASSTPASNAPEMHQTVVAELPAQNAAEHLAEHVIEPRRDNEFFVPGSKMSPALEAEPAMPFETAPPVETLKPVLFTKIEEPKLPPIETATAPSWRIEPDDVPVHHDSRGTVFANLVGGDDDIVGLVAYSIYKLNKYDWRAAFKKAKNREPNQDEIDAFTIGESTLRRLSIYRQLAENALSTESVERNEPSAVKAAANLAAKPSNLVPTVAYLCVAFGFVVAGFLAFRYVGTLVGR